MTYCLELSVDSEGWCVKVEMYETQSKVIRNLRGKQK